MKIDPELVKHLIGGSWPDTGFSWSCVDYFVFENGVLEPYDFFGILPADGFILEAKATNFLGC